MEILVCLDKSSFTEKVLYQAKVLGAHSIDEVKIKILHIVDETISSSVDGIENDLKTALLKRGQEIKSMSVSTLENVEYIEKFGNPKVIILELMNLISHDLILLGSHGRTRLKNSVLGGFTETVLKYATKPVLVIPF